MNQRALDETGQRFEMVGANEASTGVPDWLKIVAGCGCALALLAGIVLLLTAVGLKWIVGSGDQVPTEWIADRQSAGAFHTDAIGSDPGLAAFATELLREIERLQREPGSKGWEWMEDLEPRDRPADAEALGEWLPTDAALVIEATEAGIEIAGAVNLPRFGRLVRSLVKGATEAVEPHGEHEVREGEEGLLFGFVGGTLLLANGRASLERCFDRIDVRAAAGANESDTATLGETRLAGVAARADVFGILRDRAAVDVVVAFLGRAAGLDATDFDWLPAQPVDVGLGLDLSTRDELAGELVITCADADVARRTVAALQEQIDPWTARADEQELDLSVTVDGRGPRVEAIFRLRGLRRLAEDLARHMFRP